MGSIRNLLKAVTVIIGWNLSPGKGRGKKTNRGGRRLGLEPLEQRQMLTAVAPVLAASANPVKAGDSVTYTAAMPYNATSDVQFYVNGSAAGSPVTPTAPTDADALGLDGSSGYVTVPTTNFTGGNFTVSFWFKPANADENTVVLDRGWAYNNQPGDIEFKINYSTGKLDFQAQTSDGNWLFGWDDPESALSASFNVGQWNHVVVTRSGYAFSMWMNGVLAATAVSEANIDDSSDSNPFLLGAGTSEDGSPGGFFDGSVSELDIWTTALSTSQVAQLYNNGYVFAAVTSSGYPDSGQLVAGFHLSGNADDFVGGPGGTPSSSGVSWPTNTAASTVFTLSSTTFSSPGTQAIKAEYLGDGTYSDATSYFTETVLNTSSTSLTYSYSGSSIEQGQTGMALCRGHSVRNMCHGLGFGLRASTER